MISDKIYALNSFKEQYDALIALSVCETIPNLIWNEKKEFLLERIDWNNMLGIASVLSYSDNTTYLDAALRICQTCISQEITTDIQKSASAIILSNLTNKPAIDLAIKRGFIDNNYREHFPLEFKIQSTRTQIENSIFVNDKLIHLNKFQKKVHNVYESSDTISISAPTSAGKSFILCTILVEELINKKQNIVYIVPTRALISQVEFDLKNLVKDYDIKNVNISTVPQNEIEQNTSNVFVFTQERLHWFLIDNEVKIDLLIIDEAHKIEDGNRGILLQQKIEEVVRNNKKVKVYFSSPFTSNPEILLENVDNNSKKKKVNTQFVSVNQNLIYATQFPRKSDKWNLNLCLVDKNILLGQIDLKDRPSTNTTKIITFLSHAISANQSGNIIYSNGAAESEKKALVLYGLLDDVEKNNYIVELQKIIKKTIHKDYTLVKVLDKGIAFHYGNMPLLIRQEVEKLFKEGHIKYLICTSTLLEGINLPAKSIFIRKPSRGKNIPLNQNDFWNLAGRAGRWGQEFSGNIICVNPQKWDIQPNPSKSKQLIKRAIDDIEKNYQELIDYIENDTPRDIAEERQDLEFAFGYYYIKFLNNDFKLKTSFHIELINLFLKIKPTILIPDYIIKRNPGISPIAQQNLYNYFKENIERIDEFIPVYPEDENAVNEYTKLVGRMGKTISNYPPMLNFSRAILLVNWMRGRPLSLLISSSYKSYQKNNKKNKTLPIVIREVMSNVETFVRFRFAKDSGCYIDILRYFLELNGMHNLESNIPELNLWLEFGVSQKTHLSMLSIGLSRNTVIELSEFIPESKMTKNECLQWLKKQDFEQLGLSTIIINDIKRNIDIVKEA